MIVNNFDILFPESMTCGVSKSGHDDTQRRRRRRRQRRRRRRRQRKRLQRLEGFACIAAPTSLPPTLRRSSRFCSCTLLLPSACAALLPPPSRHRRRVSCAPAPLGLRCLARCARLAILRWSSELRAPRGAHSLFTSLLFFFRLPFFPFFLSYAPSQGSLRSPLCPYSRSLRSPCAGQVRCARQAARNPSPPPSLLSFFRLSFFPFFLSYRFLAPQPPPSRFLRAPAPFGLRCLARCARLAILRWSTRFFSLSSGFWSCAPLPPGCHVLSCPV